MTTTVLETKAEHCDFELTKACRKRNGVTLAEDGYSTTIEGVTRFACDECADEIVSRIAKDLESRISAKRDPAR